MIEVRFWGVRGSVATAGADQAQVGGNTTCVEVRCGNHTLILDAGTGLRGLGHELMRRGKGQVGGTNAPVDLLLTHYHWDHIQGFPFFLPAYQPDNELTVRGPLLAKNPQASVRELLAGQMSGPYFPVGLDAMQAKTDYQGFVPGQTLHLSNDVTVRTARTCHPNGGVAYRIEHGSDSVVFATDTEHDPSGELDANLMGLAHDAGMLIYDAQYTPEEYAAGKKGWGHSTAQEGVRLAKAANTNHLVLFHHDPTHSDWQIASIEAATREQFDNTVAAREGLILRVEDLRTTARLIECRRETDNFPAAVNKG